MPHWVQIKGTVVFRPLLSSSSEARRIKAKGPQPRPRQCAVAPHGANRLIERAVPVKLPHIERGAAVFFNSPIFRTPLA